jgi:predicted RNase H-like nuclease
MRVVGVDGAPGGQVEVAFDRDSTGDGRWQARSHKTFIKTISSHSHVACVGVDMPIGLLEDGIRRCDVESRLLLGPKRSSKSTPNSRSWSEQCC